MRSALGAGALPLTPWLSACLGRTLHPMVTQFRRLESASAAIELNGPQGQRVREALANMKTYLSDVLTSS